MKRIVYIVTMFITSLFLLLPSSLTVEASNFKDVPNDHVFKREIDHLVILGALSGYSDGTFKPDNKVTRGQAAKIIVEALNMPLITPEKPTFKDVSRNHDFYEHIETLAARGIVSGNGGRFNPQGNLKRSHMAKIISNSMRLTKQSNYQFTDVSQNNEFYPYIDRLATTGITTGCGPGKFCSEQTVTRGQIAAFISRGIERWLSSDEFIFDRDLKIGMTQEEVIAIEGNPSYRDPFQLEYDWVAHSDVGASLLLYFDDNKLDHLIVYLNIPALEVDLSEEYFNSIVESMYISKYGEPTEMMATWEDLGGCETLYAEWNLGGGKFYKVEMSKEPVQHKVILSQILYAF